MVTVIAAAIPASRATAPHAFREGRYSGSAHLRGQLDVPRLIRPRNCYDEPERRSRNMGAARTYAAIDPATGKLDRHIFSEQTVYDAEMERIFGRARLMIGHESLVTGPDDFYHNYMGEDPVILTRDGAGRLHALLNMCRHRGNRVVPCDDGNAKRFMCT